MIITKQSDGQVIADKAELAGSIWRRLVGLIGRRDLVPGYALVLPSCREIHTFFMIVPIDVLFIDAQSKVVCAVEELTPWRITGYCWNAVRAIELPAGTISACRIRIGDVLAVEDANQ